MSTLRPGKVSQAIADLRDAAIREMDAIPPGVERATPSFDRKHETNDYARDVDSESWVSKYPGQNSPHIGNGRGGVK